MEATTDAIHPINDIVVPNKTMKLWFPDTSCILSKNTQHNQ